MNRCSGIKADGGRCQAPAITGSMYCVGHDPARVAERRRRSSKARRAGGRGRASAELERGDAAIAGQLLGGARACIRDGMAAKEQEELIERLEALEQAEEQRMQERRGFEKLRDKLKRLERARRKEMIAIPQKDGTIRRFPQSAVKDAYANLMARMGAGEDAPPEHPLLEAARNSSDPGWSESTYSVDETWTEPVEDFSEP